MNWLVLDDANKPEWEAEASRLASETLGRRIIVHLDLPTAEAAKKAFASNEDLYGRIAWGENDQEDYQVFEVLPYHGVFVLHNEDGRQAKLAVWQSSVEKPVKDGDQEVPDVTDLATRTIMTFPRRLLRGLVKRLKDADEKGKLSEPDYWDRVCLVPVRTWLAPQFGLAQFVRPNNASDLLAQICSVRRYLVSRAGAMGFGPERRSNHLSFDGRICPVDTPESEMVGISLQLARGATVDADGHVKATDSAAAIDRISWGASLIPFSHQNDGVRDMMGAKNLRQATPVLGREAPCVRTGSEEELAKRMKPLFEAGICPESRDTDKSLIAMGCDLLTAYLPWNGWNLDDAIVVSEAVVNRMAVIERQSFSREIKPEYKLVDLASPKELACGAVIARFRNGGGKEIVVRYNDPTPAQLTEINLGEGEQVSVENESASLRLTYEIEKRIPLGHGDKLMARHGNKGVVGRVVPADEMPRLPDDPKLPASVRGRPIEILVNPHGVLSRMNPGQLLETHLGWLFRAAGKKESDVRAKGKSETIGAPVIGQVDEGRVQDLLVASGLDRNGKIKLLLPDGTETQNPVVVGYEHFVRLHHIPELKAQARAGGEDCAYDSVTCQPVGGRKRGGGQRLGEMEVWALCAHRADKVLAEMLGEKSDRNWEAGGGFEHLMRDWLRAMCIDMKCEKKTATFRFLKAEKELIDRLGGDSHLITSTAACRQVVSGVFSCTFKNKSTPKNKTCGWTLPGTYRLPADARKGRKLQFGAVLEKLGFGTGTEPLEKLSEGRYRLPLVKNDKPAGSLVVALEGYKAEAVTLNVIVSPSPSDPPAAWPGEKEFKELHLRAKVTVNKEERKKYNLEETVKDLKAEYLLDALTCPEPTRSLGEDFYVVCPRHTTSYLHVGPPYETEMTAGEGGVFDRKIFAGRDSWGFIKLPVDVEHPLVKIKKKNRTAKKVMLSVIPVLPLHYRPITGAVDSILDTDELSQAYVEIVRSCKAYEAEEKKKAEVKKAAEVKKDEAAKALQQAVDSLFKLLEKRLVRKRGFLRHDGLGRRVDRSFRLVIAPNPELNWDQAAVPCSVLWELLGDLVLEAEEREAEREQAYDGRVRVHKAGWTWQRTEQPDDAQERLEAYLKDHPDLVVLLNRQPSLHRDNIQAFHPIVAPASEGDVLQLSPLCCKGFAADFDGDEMAGHLPLSEAAQNDARILLPSRNMRSIATGESLVHLDRDLVTGLELIYRNRDRYRQVIAEEFARANVTFDEEAEKSLSKDDLEPSAFGEQVIGRWCQVGGEEAVAKISALARVAFRACTTEGVSFGYFDLKDLAASGKLVAKPESDKWAVMDALSPLATMVNAGANGSKQIGQVVLRRGKLAAAGKDVEVKSSLIGGMPWEDFFTASQNARYSMSQKKIGTQKAGHLTRQLVLGLWPWTIVEDDCGCAGERSVLTCRSEGGVCAKCFGRLPNGEEPSVGFPIGLVAAQSLGERGTQLSMQVFHTGTASVDIAYVSKLMTGGEWIDDAERFVKELRQGAYEKINERYFQLLWRVLKVSPEHKLSASRNDPWVPLVRGKQKKALLDLLETGASLSLESPIAKILFNLFDKVETEVDR
ncbi:MAG: hypothetical protein Q4G65_11970 [bacterium]|nr:hypothetical protein [bacterium]